MSDKDLPDFDELVRLAKEDPEELERIRAEAVETLINKAPLESQRRLRGLQFQVDMERQKAKNPMDSCIRVSKMMHDSFNTLRDALNAAQTTHVTSIKQVLNKGKATRVKKDEVKEDINNVVSFKGKE